MRSKLLENPTHVEQQIQSRVSRLNDKQNSDEQVSHTNIQQQKKPIEQNKYNKSLILHYTHEGRLATYKKDFHHIWQQLFQQTPVMSTRLIVGHRNSRNAIQELVSKRPSKNNDKQTH